MARCKHPKESRQTSLILVNPSGTKLTERCTLCHAERTQRHVPGGRKPWVWGPWRSPGARVKAALLARNPVKPEPLVKCAWCSGTGVDNSGYTLTSCRYCQGTGKLAASLMQMLGPRSV